MSQKIIVLISVIFFMSAITIHAEVPQLINYQGALNDADNNPVTAQNLSVVFNIYDAATAGTSLWTETQPVNVTDGVFNVLLGSVTPIPYEVFDGSDRYLSMKIGEDSEMTPRKHLVSVGNAFHAHTADNVAVGNYVETINGVSPNESGNIAIVAGDNVDVSATSSGIKISTTGGGEGFSLPYEKSMDYDGYLLTLQNTNSAGKGISIESSLSRFKSSATGTAILGVNDKTMASIASSSCGISCTYIDNTDNIWTRLSEANNGLYSYHTKDGATITIAFITGDNHAVWGWHDGGNIGQLGTGVYGVYAYGGIGSSSSANNAVNSVDNTYAVYGEHESGPYGYIGGDTYSVYGQNGNNSGYLGGGEYGVCGRVGNKTGYLGHNNKAGYFIGDVDIDGDLTVSGRKNFKIDHPLDPENKYLYHYCVESDELSNVYSGNAILNSNGETVVELPEWFEALNTDFRYQLTCIGGFARVYIAEEISQNQFKIAGGDSGMKISWQVTGVRNDPAAKANPPQAEQAKSTEDAGYYLHPKAYSASEAQGISGRQQIKLRQEYEEIDRERKILSEKQREIEARDAQHQAEMEKQMEAEKQQRKDLR